MTLQAIQTAPSEILPILAGLYGGNEQDFAPMLPQLKAAWMVRDSTGKTAGAVGLRPSPAHGMEVMGGAFPGPEQDAAALALMMAAQAFHPHLYAYAEAHLLPAEALKPAGLRRAGAYTRMTGPVPALFPTVPEGFRIMPLSEVRSPHDRLTAQRTHSDRLGHTHVPDEAGQPDFGGSDDRLGRLACDVSGAPAGLCRAWLDGETLALGTPGVRADLRGTGLRQALLLLVGQAARAAGATRLELEAWSDTEAERAEDQALGLVIATETPIYASMPL
ncbi:hypothetical protein HLB42_01590 [Deinococcus sp. D7000]|nr:hypothetical protein HLB42_01590 [Deinococcus sp. D7000]